MIGSGTVSGSQQAALGTATQHTTCSVVARGAQRAALGDAFQQTACPDVVSGSPANLPKRTLVLEPSGTPACKKGRSADEECVGPAVAARPSSSVEALQTPQCNRCQFSEAGVVVGGGGLSPAMATRLAQSCRKSPVTLATPRTLAPQTPRGPPAEQQARDAEATEVRRLKSLVQPAVLKVFEYVSQKVINTGLRDFLSTASQDRTAYDHLAYLRGKHKQGLLTSDDYALLARTPQVLGPSVYGAVEGAKGHWRWTFVLAGVDVVSEIFNSKVAADDDLRELQLSLFPAWHHADSEQRGAHLRLLIQQRQQKRQIADVAQGPVLTFARRRLLQASAPATAPSSSATRLSYRGGLRNLGNTCYLNAVTQCLIHSAPFREDLRRQPAGASVLGDALKALLTAYEMPECTELAVLPHLADWLARFLAHSAFTGGAQEDAAECLMHILMAVDGGDMQRRVCGANAAVSVESMLLCPADESAQVSRASGVVDMAALVMSTLTGEQAIAEAAAALVLRIDNVYEVEGEFFSVDARADWSRTAFGVTVRDDPGVLPEYTVAAYVAHVADDQVSGAQRMRGGHYVAYVLSDGSWFEFDDAVVRRLAAPPSRFPYLVFLSRADNQPRRRLVKKQGGASMRALLLSRALPQVGATSWGSGARGDLPATSSRRSPDRARSCLPQVGTGRVETGRDPSGRGRSGHDDLSGRDRSGRDQSGRDRSGRDQSGRDLRAQDQQV